MSDLKNLTDADFGSEVLSSPIPVLVDFWAAWCGPCRMIAPAVEKIAAEYSGKVKVMKVNVDDCHETAMKYAVHAIPTLIIYKDGQPAERIVGAVPESAIKAKLDNLL